eukprot:1161449-Pelagomonas_calceolata.AAC.6
MSGHCPTGQCLPRTEMAGHQHSLLQLTKHLAPDLQLFGQLASSSQSKSANSSYKGAELFMRAQNM